MEKSPPLPFFILRGHEGNVTALHFNTEASSVINIHQTLLSGSDIGEIFIWNLKTFRALFKLTSSDKKTILFLKYYKSKLIAQNKDVINVWTYQNNDWNVMKKFESDCVGFCASVFWLFNDNAFITLFNQDKHLLNIYNIDVEKKTQEFEINSAGGLCMCLKIIKLQEKQLILVGFENGNIELIDYERNVAIHSVTFHKELITCLDFDSEFKMRGISGSADEFLQIWSIENNNCLKSVHQLALPKPGINDVKIRHDGKIVIAAGFDFSIRIFSWKTLKPLAILNFHEQTIHCLAYSSFPVDKNNSVFASGSKDKSIALWSIY